MFTNIVPSRGRAKSAGHLRSPSGNHRVSVCLPLVLACAVCGCQKAPHPEELFPPEPVTSLGPVSEKISASVYLDATPSMEGFAHPDAEGQYGIFLQELDLALQKGWRSASAQYFRFGTEKRTIEQRPVYVHAIRSDFYGGTGFLDTRIDIALNEASRSNLIVAVTDLFQQDADVSALIDKIKQKVLPGRLAVGVLGVKAGFSGVIHDVGQSRMSFPWGSQGSVARYRPFYVVLVGNTADVVHFAEVLRGLSKSVQASSLVVLSPELLRTPMNWRRARVTHSRGVNQNASIVHPPVPGGLVFKRLGQDDVEIDATLDYEPVPGAPTVRFDRVALKADVVLWAASGLFTRPGARRLNGGPGSNGFQLIQEKEKLVLKVRIPRQQLPYQGTYVVKLTPVINTGVFDFPGFCDEWNLDMLTTTKLTPAMKFDGTKTQNLAVLIHTVWAVMMQEYQQSIGSLYFYLER